MQTDTIIAIKRKMRLTCLVALVGNTFASVVLFSEHLTKAVLVILRSYVFVMLYCLLLGSILFFFLWFLLFFTYMVCFNSDLCRISLDQQFFFSLAFVSSLSTCSSLPCSFDSFSYFRIRVSLSCCSSSMV